MCAMAGVTPEIRVDTSRLRPEEARELRGDPSKIERGTLWRARTPIEATLESLLGHWSRGLERAAK